MAPAVGAGDGKDEKSEDTAGVPPGADGGCDVATVPESGEFWVDVGGSAQNQKCIVGGDECADQGELANGGKEAMRLRRLARWCPPRTGCHAQSPGGCVSA